MVRKTSTTYTQFELDAATVTVALEQYVRQQLKELASERVEF
jgi:hypothetical protein